MGGSLGPVSWGVAWFLGYGLLEGSVSVVSPGAYAVSDRRGLRRLGWAGAFLPGHAPPVEVRLEGERRDARPAGGADVGLGSRVPRDRWRGEYPCGASARSGVA